MQQALTIGLYLAMGGLLVILALGVTNLLRNDSKRASRSNMLMWLRVSVQAVAIIILVVLGIVSGMIKF